jgi:hypothetical protein
MSSRSITSTSIAITLSRSPHPRGFEDQVDEDLAVPGLQQPLLGRGLGAHPGLGERLLGALGVLALDHQVDVVARRRPAAGPAAEPAAEEVGNVPSLERRDRALEAVGQLFGDLALAQVLRHASFGAPSAAPINASPGG